MPWWSWALIWTGLALGLLAMLTLFGVALFRKLMALVDALSDLGDRVSIGTADAEQDVTEVRRIPAIFQSRDRLADVVADRRFERLHRRQLRRDRAIGQGKLFGTISASTKDSPHAQ